MSFEETEGFPYDPEVTSEFRQKLEDLRVITATLPAPEDVFSTPEEVTEFTAAVDTMVFRGLEFTHMVQRKRNELMLDNPELGFNEADKMARDTINEAQFAEIRSRIEKGEL